ncbi:N-acetyl-1-D-myo-inositol-2-amino-2-deoxy-alpha-D-glucopyranoside deacetylase [Corynebacterium otitidis]
MSASDDSATPAPASPDARLEGLKVVAVHAHPDDEALAGGGLLAHLARRGAEVTVVTCTLGEQGEVIGEPYQNLVADRADQLGGFRIAELMASHEALGVKGRFLGAPGKYRDSGMAGDPASRDPRAFGNRYGEAAEDLKRLFAELKPDVVVTYDERGGYGHPDHVQIHRLVMAEVAERPVRRVLWTVRDRKRLDAGSAAIRTLPEGWRRPGDGELDAVDEPDLHVALDRQDVSRKIEALGCHPTQVWVADGRVSRTNPTPARAAINGDAAVGCYALSNLIAQPITAAEHVILGAGEPLPEDARDADGFGDPAAGLVPGGAGRA